MSPKDNGMNKVLIIDDDMDARESMESFLSRRQIEAKNAPDGREGICIARAWRPDLILCDLAMPEMDGYEVLTTLRQDEDLADIPLIFLTGQDAPQKIRQGMILGADDYLLKTTEPKIVLDTVLARIARHRMEKQRQTRQFEQAMELFSEVIHELRDPLFVVFGCTDELKHRGGNSNASPQQTLDRIQSAISRMQEVFSEALFVAKSKMRRLSVNPIGFDLRQFCEHFVAEHDCAERLRLVCTGEVFPIVADALHLRRAFENLISNAIKYSSGLVFLKLSQAGQNYCVEFEDSGLGIPVEDQDRVFEPFFRGSNTANFPGHGLGLSIVKTCVEQQGATIRFESLPGKGSRFFLALPLRPAVVESQQPNGIVADGGAPSPSRATLLADELGRQSSRAQTVKAVRPYGIIVDDDPLVRELLRDWTDRFGGIAIVGEAGSLSQARTLVCQHQPEVVFLDVNLPDGVGFDLLPDLKPGVSIVFVTAAEEYATDAFDCQAVDFLLKPFSQERFERALMRARQRVSAAATDSGKQAAEDSFLVKTMTETRYIKAAEIRRIIAYGEYSRVFWRQDHGTLFRKSLKQWSEELPENRFVRVHRNAIINLDYLDHVKKLSRNHMQVFLRDSNQPVEVSLRLMPKVNQAIKARTLRS